MSKEGNTYAFIVLLFASLLLNLFFLFPSYFVELRSSRHLGWSLKAALEAEAVAGIPCSGNGEAFVDGVVIHGVPVCECYLCYRGTDCSDLDSSCTVNVNGGDPLFLEPYWKQHAASSAVVLPGWHRMSYSADNPNSYTTMELERHIRELHAYVGNAITEERYIVMGVGATQLLNAAVHALSQDNARPPARVVGSIPYYNAYESQTMFYDSKAYDWSGSAANWINSSDIRNKEFIEFVTSPNNPDGQLKKPALNISSVIYDHVYYWPHFTAIPSKVDGDVMLFTVSKASGHAGTRLGWAVIKDKEVYEKILMYVAANCLGVSHDAQLRALKLIKTILAQTRTGKGDIFRYGYEKMRDRWKTLNDVLASTNRFSLQSIGPSYCRYFNQTRDPSPAYGWLKCELDEDEDCYQVLLDAGVETRSGSKFGDSKRYTRLSLLRRDSDFELFINKLKNLLASEGSKFI